MIVMPAGWVMGNNGNMKGDMLLQAWTRGYLALGRRPRGTLGAARRLSIENAPPTVDVVVVVVAVVVVVVFPLSSLLDGGGVDFCCGFSSVVGSSSSSTTASLPLSSAGRFLTVVTGSPLHVCGYMKLCGRPGALLVCSFLRHLARRFWNHT